MLRKKNRKRKGTRTPLGKDSCVLLLSEKYIHLFQISGKLDRKHLLWVRANLRRRKGVAKGKGDAKKSRVN